MTGLEHYLESERWLGLADCTASAETSAKRRELAQVHAMLALAAATVESVFVASGEFGYGRRWREVLKPADAEQES